MPEFINPRVDWAFKRIFGTEDTKECLITFLNGVFEGEFVIKDVKHLKTEQTRHQKRERGVVFDVACVTDDGRHIIVEMQKKEQRYFVDRALYYSSKAIVEQAKPGEWDFHLTPVYTVCFMDFIAETGIPCQFRTDIGFGLLEEKGSMLDEPTEPLSCGSKGQDEQQGCDAKTQARQLGCDAKEQASQLVPHKRRQTSKTKKSKAWQLSGLQYGFEKMRVVFLQLPLFEKKEPECMEIFDCWIYVLNNMEHLKEIPFLDKYPVFRKLAAIGDLQKLTPEERDYYEEDVKIMRDLYATDKWEKEKRRMEREAARKEVEAAQKKVEAAHKEVETAHKEVETAHKEVDKLRREKEEAYREKEEAYREKEEAYREKEEAYREKEEATQKAKVKEKLAIAKKLLSLELPLLQIMQATGLTKEQIDSLKK